MAAQIGSIADEVVDEACDPKAIVITHHTSNICIARRLRMRRSSSGISDREFCARLGIDRYDLEAYERGVKRVNANLLIRIAKLLDVQPDYFFKG